MAHSKPLKQLPKDTGEAIKNNMSKYLVHVESLRFSRTFQKCVVFIDLAESAGARERRSQEMADQIGEMIGKLVKLGKKKKKRKIRKEKGTKGTWGKMRKENEEEEEEGKKKKDDEVKKILKIIE